MAKHLGTCERGAFGGRGIASTECPECVAQVAAGIIHTPDCKGAFGRRDESCGRCRALMAGVPAATKFRALGRYS